MKKLVLLKRRHNKLKRRIELGVDSPGDKEKLSVLKMELGYK